MKKLAVCVPTYERSDVVEELLFKSLRLYYDNNIDVFIYDSSTDDKTKKVVADYQREFDNLVYVRIDSSVHSNMKVYKIFQEFERNRKYEYIWVCSDSIRWAEDTVKRICELTKDKYDFLIVNYRDVEKIGTKIYTDKNQLFLDCAWHMTLYGATIIRVETVLKDVNWNYLTTKYMIPNRINHSHVALYFEQINKMPAFQAFHLSVGSEKLSASTLKKIPGWHHDTFYVWGTCWPSMIKALPAEYLFKKQVIKKSGVNSSILSAENILFLRNGGIYNLRIFLTYLGRWHTLTDISIRLLFIIAIMPKDFYKSEKERKLKKKIKSFCKAYTYIYVYGCGTKANRFAGYLDEMGIEYKSFLVSKKEAEKDQFRDHPVKQYTRDLLDNSRVGLIVALNEANTKEIIQTYPEIQSKKNVFSEYRGEQQR